ncbi:hypothetical protein [Azospirillum sp. TSH100]|uniref:hypothetical protein n=1 Tax=Azospirillum sp. TSH100 TaxID=652764 RepID=UPI0010AB1C7A|nr:hypothetical protein [Azospirillum sp. TSH100]QCG89342.1 hypothetical protein E6C72_16255 [Azospirillum sp. TSH100]
MNTQERELAFLRRRVADLEQAIRTLRETFDRVYTPRGRRFADPDQAFERANHAARENRKAAPGKR